MGKKLDAALAGNDKLRAIIERNAFVHERLHRELEQARAENEELRAEITRLSQLLEQTRQEAHTIMQEAGTFIMAVPLTSETMLVPGKSYDVSIGPFKSTAVIQAITISSGAPGELATITGRFRMLQP